MRKKLLLSTAALLAGVAIASAQDMGGKPTGQSGAAQGGAQTERGAAGASREQGRSGQMQRGESKQGESKQGQQRSQAQEKQTTGQAQPGQHEQNAQQSQAEKGKQGQSPQRSQAQDKREQTTGQAQPEQKAQPSQAQQGKEQGKQGQAQQRSQPKQQQETTGQAPQRQQGQQAPQQGQAQQGQTPKGQTSQQGQTSGQAGSSATGQAGTSATGQAGGSVNLTAQQRTKIQQTVLAGSNVPRANNVNFALSVGTAVPTSVRVVEVVPALIEINPAWRGHQYFVVRDEIIIVDHSRKIVAVVPVGSGGASLGGGSRVSGGAGEMNLTTEQIRQIQIVLNERGFNIGRPDGRLGRRTVEALTAFQRKQGFQATGRIDAQTASALGVSNVSGGQSGGATAGQGGATSQSGKAQQAPGQQNQGASQP